jgi:hypothetical protein
MNIHYALLVLHILLVSCTLNNGLKSRSISSINKEAVARPHISTIVAKDHSLGDDWDKFKRGQVDAAIQFVEIYHDRNLYFLARDAEYLYDTVSLLYKDDPSVLDRIKLINVSRTNMNDPNLKKYLAQEGISEETLKLGKRFVFIDSGFHGTIVDVIKSKFPKNFHRQLHGHFLASANFNYPSTRVFLQHLNNDPLKVARTDPAHF